MCLISSCLLQDYYDDNDVLMYSIDLLSLQDYTRTFLHIILSLSGKKMKRMMTPLEKSWFLLRVS